MVEALILLVGVLGGAIGSSFYWKREADKKLNAELQYVADQLKLIKEAVGK